MAIFNQGILGGFSGKVGSVVGCVWRGKNVMRAMPTPKKSYTPSEGQQVQRDKFAMVTQFLYPLKSILSLYFGSPQGDKSRYNMATSYHLKNAVVWENNMAEIIYDKVLISRGDIPGLEGADMQNPGNLQIAVSWMDNSDQPTASDTDELYMVIFSPALENYLFYTPASVIRKDVGITVTLPNIFLSTEIMAWATFVNATKKVAATNVYLGHIVVS